ncbi:hypothetical protein CT0861_03177 [Colletotrichum tofieldiae]|uniref:Uncharacterized protein n=1 Tax=Colletotrichum tofieldiae TaxID=708197 RepID=A0A166RLR7_9PEZI|nr:hypothetical protein CT0861_03177 [Colletotrichum tofieldiae]
MEHLRLHICVCICLIRRVRAHRFRRFLGKLMRCGAEFEAKVRKDVGEIEDEVMFSQGYGNHDDGNDGNDDDHGEAAVHVKHANCG